MSVTSPRFMTMTGPCRPSPVRGNLGDVRRAVAPQTAVAGLPGLPPARRPRALLCGPLRAPQSKGVEFWAFSYHLVNEQRMVGA